MASLNVLIHATNLWVERFLTPLMAEGSKFQQGCLPLVRAWVRTLDFLLYSIPRLSEVSVLVRINPFVKYLSRTLRMTVMFKARVHGSRDKILSHQRAYWFPNVVSTWNVHLNFFFWWPFCSETSRRHFLLCKVSRSSNRFHWLFLPKANLHTVRGCNLVPTLPITMVNVG